MAPVRSDREPSLRPRARGRPQQQQQLLRPLLIESPTPTSNEPDELRQLADDSSGIDAVKDILAEFNVPVIFITAFPERLLTGERPEPTFLITKPFQRSTVKAAISQALFFDQSTVPTI